MAKSQQQGRDTGEFARSRVRQTPEPGRETSKEGGARFKHPEGGYVWRAYGDGDYDQDGYEERDAEARGPRERPTTRA